MKLKTKHYLTPTLLSLLFAPALSAEEPQEKTPYTKANNSLITVSGKVTEANADTFRLDYGEGAITVEMDDYDWYHEGYEILANDQVTVYGRVDADSGETRTIEAGSVFVEGLNTFFFANDVDEEDLMSTHVYSAPVVFPLMELRGTIATIDGDEFVLKTTAGSFMIDSGELDYDPFDDEGYQRLSVGDRVSVIGTYDRGIFEKDEIMAESVVSLRQ